MNKNNKFQHLPFPQNSNGNAFYKRPNIKPPIRTVNNINNRKNHGQNLKKQSSSLSQFWHSRREDFEKKHGQIIHSQIPFLLEIDPTADIDFLRGLGFEIVSEVDNGFIIVSSEDIDLKLFNNKINDYIEDKTRSGSPAKVYGLCEDIDRVKRVLSNQLYEKVMNSQQKGIIIVDIYIECAGKQPEPELPPLEKDESESNYNKRLEILQHEYYRKLDEIQLKREREIEKFIDIYNGELLSDYISDEASSFSFRLKISYDGLKDFVLNYPYVFEVREYDEIVMENLNMQEELSCHLENIYPPLQGSPIVCVIDSGIQEMHYMLNSSVIQSDSYSFVPDNKNVQDEVANGGHGTRVAGAIQYGSLENILELSEYTLPCFLRNIRILDENNTLPSNINQSEILINIVQHFSVNVQEKTKIYNHSIGERRPFVDMYHMSPWAITIDRLSYENDILFVQSAGNISAEIIRALIQSGHNYPQYFGDELTRISDPAQSLQALTVGSISSSDFDDADRIALGKSNKVSAFSRIGPGIWDSIKPDVVEYGGTYAVNKKGMSILTTPNEVCIDLIRRSPEGPSHARDAIGTSFSTPKVSHIAAEIQRLFPNASALLYRALIVQSATYPINTSLLNKEEKVMLIRQMGYGFTQPFKSNCRK